MKGILGRFQFGVTSAKVAKICSDDCQHYDWNHFLTQAKISHFLLYSATLPPIIKEVKNGPFQ